MEKLEQTLIEILETQTGKTKEELQELLYEIPEKEGEAPTLKDNAKELILELDINRIETIKANTNAEWEKKVDKIKKDQTGKGKKEGLEELERLLMEEFDVKAKDKKGIDLVKEIIKANTKSNMTADEIKKHPAYLELEERIEKDYVPKSEYEEVKATHERYISEQERDKRLKIVRGKALEVFRSLNPKLAENANIRANQEEMFLRVNVDSLNVDTDSLLLLNEDGNRREDGHGNPITLEKYIKELVPKHFEILVQHPGGGAGNRNTGGAGGGSGTTIKAPDTLDEFTKQMSLLTGQELIDYHEKYHAKFQ